MKMKRLLASVLALLLVVSILPIGAMAAEDTKAGQTVDEIKSGDTMNNNKGTVTTNNGNLNHNLLGGEVVTNNKDITTNHTGGTVKTNASTGTITENWGTVNDNSGKIKTNEAQPTEGKAGVVVVNNNSIGTNKGTVETNAEGGKIETNNGTVITNNEGGTVETNANSGKIETNNGKITTNKGMVGDADKYKAAEDKAIKDVTGEPAPSEPVEITKEIADAIANILEDQKSGNFGTITDNGAYIFYNGKDGFIETNYGDVNLNNGTVETNNQNVYKNTGTVETNNGAVSQNFGTVETNNGRVFPNFGTVETNNKYVYQNTGTVETNNGGVLQNFGTVETNEAGGTVETNEAGGTVVTNNGTVGVVDEYETTPNGYRKPIPEDGTGNFGNIDINNGSLIVNHEDATVGINNGDIELNYGDIDTNNDYVVWNYGTVETNNDYVVWNYGTVETNTIDGTVWNETTMDQNGENVTGTVTNNYGTMITNTGKVDEDGRSIYKTEYGVQVQNTDGGAGTKLLQAVENTIVKLADLFKRDGYELVGYNDITPEPEYPDEDWDGPVEYALNNNPSAQELSATEFHATRPSILSLIWKAIVKPAAPSGEPEPKTVQNNIPTTLSADQVKGGAYVRRGNLLFRIIEVGDDYIRVATVPKLSEQALADMLGFLKQHLSDAQIAKINGEPALLEQELVTYFFGGTFEHISFYAAPDLFA